MRNLINSIFSVSMAILALICFLALISFNRYDACLFYDSTLSSAYSNIMGGYGANIAGFLLYMTGFSALWLVPSFLCIALNSYSSSSSFYYPKTISFLLFIPVTASLASLFSTEFFPGIVPGGILGTYTSRLLLSCFGEEYRAIFLFIMVWALLIICLQLSFVRPLTRYAAKLPGIYHTMRALNFVIQKISYVFRMLRGQSLSQVRPVSISDIQDDPFWQYYALVKKNQKN